MYDYYHKISIWSRMEFIIDYTATPRNRDMRQVELFGEAQPIELIIRTNPYTEGME